MHLRKPPLASEFRDHPKFIAGHVYLRKESTPRDYYLATKCAEHGALLHRMCSGNVWTTKGTAPFGSRGRVDLWEDVTDRVWIADSIQ